LPDRSGEGAAFGAEVAAALPRAGGALDVWRALGSAGILNRLHADYAADAGPGLNRRLLDELLAELDARLPVGLVLSVCVQVATVIPLLQDLARRSRAAAAVLAETLRGEVIVALAVTDAAAAGSDLLGAQTRIRTTPEAWFLEGRKTWITNAGHCDYVLVLARHRAERHFTSFQWVLLPSATPGVSAEPAASELFAGSAVGHLCFDGVRLEPEHVVGAPGRGLVQFARHISTERLAGALWGRSLCRRVLADTRAYLARRQLDGASQWENAAIKERFARCLVELRCLDALCALERDDRPARAHATGPSTEAMLLKAACAERVERILAECVSLRGADAFRDGGEARLRAEAAMFGIAGGATGALLAGIAEHADDMLDGGR
jgi:alkylation response protein AidB-like acyl-CoA dehydrogenase